MKGDLLGFIDESSQNINSNTQRLWSFKKLKQKKNTAHLKANSIGCFMLNGIDTIAFPPHTKTEDFCKFLLDVRSYNPVNRICLILCHWRFKSAQFRRDKNAHLHSFWF